MKNCNHCKYRSVGQKYIPCCFCNNFDKFKAESELEEDDSYKLNPFMIVLILLTITIVFANVGIFLFNLFK